MAAEAFRNRCTIDGGTRGQLGTCYPVVWVTHRVLRGEWAEYHNLHWYRSVRWRTLGVWFGGQNGALGGNGLQ